VIDYRIHYVGARRTTAPKVLKLARRRLEPSRQATFTLTPRFEHVSIRRTHPGHHTVGIQVSSSVLNSITVDVDAGRNRAVVPVE
jgi:hypothetical protein